MKNRLSLLVLMLTFICLAASGQKNNNTPQSTTPTEISLQDSIQSLRADNADLRKQLDRMEKNMEEYKWYFGQTVDDYNDKMSHWLAFLTIILAVVAIGGPYLSNKWSEKNIEKLLKDADKKAETAQKKADEVVGSVTADAKSAKEHAEKVEGFANAVKEHAEKVEGFANAVKEHVEKAEGLLNTAKKEAEKSLKVVNELKTQIANELTPLKTTAIEAENLLKSVQDHFEKIKNSQVRNTLNIIKKQIPKENNHEEVKENKQQDQIKSIKGVKYSDDKKTILKVSKEIKHLKIPEGVIVIGAYAFCDCTSLTSIEIPESVNKIGDRAFEGCSNLTSIVIPNNVTEIGWGAFYGCSSLASIVIPNKVTVIERRAIQGCIRLTSIVIPKSVKIIEDRAFGRCSSLISIEIPDSVTKIEERVFDGCTSLAEIHLKHTSPVAFFGAFDDLDLSKITLYVPKGSLEAYKNDPFYKQFIVKPDKE